MSNLRVDFDHSLSKAPAVGGWSGLGRSDLAPMLRRVGAAHVELVGAIEAGLLPHALAAEAAPAAAERGAALAKNIDRIVVLGEPGAVAAATLLRDLAPGGPTVVLLDCADGDAVRDAFVGAERPWLAVLDGPPWVQALARALGEKAAGGWVFAEDGAGGGPLPEGLQWVQQTGSADARFGVAGGAALTLLAAAGAPLDPVVDAVTEMLARCTRVGLYDNPAYRMAAASLMVSAAAPNVRPLFLAPTRKLVPWVSHLARLWTAVTCKHSVEEGMRAAGPPAAGWLLAGDEAGAQGMGAGRSDSWLIATWYDLTAEDLVIGPQLTVGMLRKAVVDAHLAQSLEDHCPVARLRLGAADVPHVAAATVLVAHAAVTAAVLRSGDPLALPSGDAVRDHLNRVLSDS